MRWRVAGCARCNQAEQTARRAFVPTMSDFCDSSGGGVTATGSWPAFLVCLFMSATRCATGRRSSCSRLCRTASP